MFAVGVESLPKEESNRSMSKLTEARTALTWESANFICGTLLPCRWGIKQPSLVSVPLLEGRKENSAVIG